MNDLTLSAFARLTKISKPTVKKMLLDGRIKGRFIGGSLWQIAPSEALPFIDHPETKPTPGRPRNKTRKQRHDPASQ